MKDLLLSFFEATKDRVKSPFIGTFIISLLAYNWRPILVILKSKKQVEDVLIDLHALYFSDGSAILFPLLVSVFYVVGLPYLMWLFDFAASTAVIGRKKSQAQVRLSDIISRQSLAEEEAKLENLLADIRVKADLNRKIKTIEKQLEANEADSQKLRDDNSRMKEIIEEYNRDTLSEVKIAELKKDYESFKKSELFEYWDEVGASVSNHKVMPQLDNEIIVEKLIHNDLIRKVEVDGGFEYEFADRGKFFWKEYVLNAEIPKTEEIDFDDMPF
jgi:hypothetical protein